MDCNEGLNVKNDFLIAFRYIFLRWLGAVFFFFFFFFVLFCFCGGGGGWGLGSENEFNIRVVKTVIIVINRTCIFPNTGSSSL